MRYEKYWYKGEIKSAIKKQGFIPIGNVKYAIEKETEKYFSGIFYGNKNVIYNLKLSKYVEDTEKPYNIALFTINLGTLKNLGVENANISTNFNNKSKYCSTVYLHATTMVVWVLYKTAIRQIY